MRTWLTLAALCAMAPLAHARDTEGRLATILAPSNTQPAIVVRGGQFTALLQTNAALRLESAAGSFDLTAVRTEDSRGRRLVTAALPPGVPAGAYALAASSLSGDDRNFRAVFVLDAPPEEYRVVVWNNPRVSASPESPDTPLFHVTADINTGRADLVLVTGDLTASGAHEQFRIALELLNDCAAPTLVVPGPADQASGNVQPYLGAYPAAIPFGFDAYLLCPRPAVDLGDYAGRLHLERRGIRAARWSIGAGWDLDYDNLRAQLVIFVDDPLDAILGATGTLTGRNSPWGYTRIYTAPQGRSTLEWFTAGPRPIAPAAE